MVWIALSGIVLASWIVVLGLCRMAAPQSEEERRADDEAQIAALNLYRRDRGASRAGPYPAPPQRRVGVEPPKQPQPAVGYSVISGPPVLTTRAFR
jgi:hypothetical protein